MTLHFAVTWDYRCPFARNIHEHLLTGLAAGADWNVEFVPFSLGQVHVVEGEPSVWDAPGQDTGLLALQVGVVVRDEYPQRFAEVHQRLFAVRHDQGRHLEDPDTLRAVLTEADVDAAALWSRIDDGTALQAVQREHEQAAAQSDVWGVPTFLVDGQAAFVRVMNRANPSDPAASVSAIERIVELAGWPQLNEFKHTAVPA